MMEIINKLINELTGIDFWIAASALIIVLARWWYLSKTKKADQKIAKRQIAFAVVMTIITVSAIVVHRLFFSPDYTFPQDVAGILVLRIEGDDEKNSLQRDLVSTLNTELSKEAPEQKIEVRAHTEIVTEAMGLKQAHLKAREIGKNCKALLVIWGNRVDEKKFHPRLNVVEDQSRTVMAGDRALQAQGLGEISLTAELVNRPIFLTHFAAGYSFYDRNDYAASLTHFEAALKRVAANPIELNDIRFYAGCCHLELAQGQREMEWHLRRAIAYYETVVKYYTEKDFPEDWAATQNNLGIAYAKLPTNDHGQNLQKAITTFEATLKIYTEKDFPVDWVKTQFNLGNAYSTLSTGGDYTTNLQKASTAYKAALRVYNEKDFPVDWARTQNNLGSVYGRLWFTGNRDVNLQNAIALYEAALRVRTEKDFPEQWAITQYNLGSAYADLPTGDRNENLQKAIAFYEAALRVYTEENFPVEWARTQNNLGRAYAYLPTGDRSENLQKAISVYELALRVHTEKDFPMEWARIHENMGDAYTNLPTGDSAENLEKAIACYENALKILRAKASSDDDQKVAKNIKNAQSQLQNLTQK